MSDLQISVIIFSLLVATVITSQEPLPCKPPRWHIAECEIFDNTPLRMRADGIIITFEDIEQRDYFLGKNQTRCRYNPRDKFKSNNKENVR